MKIEISEIKNLIHNLLKDYDNKSEDFIAGINLVLKEFNEYIAVPDYELPVTLKKAALKYYLNNDNSQVETFTNLIDLFIRKMNKLNRTKTWDMYPVDFDNSIFLMLQSCFDGIKIISSQEDFDRSAYNINMCLKLEQEDGKKYRLNISSGGYCSNIFNEEIDEDEENEALNALENSLPIKPHYETLMLHACLKKLYQYINPKKIQELLEIEKQTL